MEEATASTLRYGDRPLPVIRNYQLTIDRIADTLRNAQQRREMRADADPRLTATEILAFLSGLELAWLVSPDIPAAETASRWAANQVAQLHVP